MSRQRQLFGLTQDILISPAACCWRRPTTIAWWSAAFPGFGHMALGHYITGFFFFIGEALINTQAQLNLAILYSFTGRFDLAKSIVDNRWLLFYALFYTFVIADSFRLSLYLNHSAALGEKKGQMKPAYRILFATSSPAGRRSPCTAVAWSLVVPGLGHIYSNKMLTGYFLTSWWAVIVYFSSLLPGIQHTALGLFEQAKTVVDPLWVLFLPSIYGFSAYDAYAATIENNRLYEKEQSASLQRSCQPAGFKLPAATGSTLYLLAAFNHSVNLELAISELKQKGIPHESICTIPLHAPRTNNQLPGKSQVDEVSLFDLPAIASAICMLFGVMWGFMWAWGPIIWGIIGLLVGAALGHFLNLLCRRHRPSSSAGKVILIVSCQAAEADRIEQLLVTHSALLVGRKE